MQTLSDKKIAIIATHGFEQSELTVPRDSLRGAGALVDIVSLEKGEIRGWDGDDWGETVPVDRTVEEIEAADYDAVVIPGGQINPDLLRVNSRVIDLVKAFWQDKKVVAAVCHGPWVLVEAGIVKDREITSYHSIKTDVINAGGKWKDAEVVADQGLVTSRKPDDLRAFSDKIAEEIAEGLHHKRAA